MKVSQALARPAFEKFYAFAGRLVFLQSFDLRLTALLEQLFTGWQFAPVSARPRNPDIKISFYCCETLPEVPRGWDQFAIAEGGRCHTNGRDLYLDFGNSLLQLQETPEVSVSLWVKQLATGEFAHATSFAVCAALRRFGLFDLHSAGVVVPESETGVLIVGPSGSGKSTLTLQLATAGWGYLSDDELLLSLVEDRVEARGFRSFFALSGEGKHKHCFEPATVFPTPPAMRAVPGFLVFTSIGGANETQLRELTQPETMTRLIRACPWATYDTAIAGRNLELLSKLARQTRSFDLSAGTDLLEPTQASRIIGDLLDGH